MFKETLTVRDLVARKSTDIHYFVLPTTSVQDAARLMQERGIAALTVMDEGRECRRVVGILSEKDISRLVAEGKDTVRATVKSVMNTHFVPVDLDTSLWDTAHAMLDNNLRHLPVMEGERPYTLISIRDVLSALTDYVDTENEALHTELDYGNQL